MTATLLALDREAWERLGDDPGAFASENDLTLGAEPDVLREIGKQTADMLRRSGATPPWVGYLAVDRARRLAVGTCAFKTPPDAAGDVEIAYFTFPGFEGQGFATAMAAALVECASAASDARQILACTLPESNASTRILEKLGFKQTGELVDPEDGPIWRWERRARGDAGS